MAQQFKNQGGAANMDPSRLKRWLGSKFINSWIHPDKIPSLQQKAEEYRKKNNLPHTVKYFHQLDDAYSHLAAQALQSLLERYDIELELYLVIGPQDANLPEPELLPKLSCWDTALVASHYGVEIPADANPPSPELVQLAATILAKHMAFPTKVCTSSDTEVIAVLNAVSKALFNADKTALEALAQERGAVSVDEANTLIEQGTALQKEMKHYSGGMFFYADQWYWGVDRLYHLEKHLNSLGVNKTDNSELLYPRPPILKEELQSLAATAEQRKEIVLEFYASIRSPYSVIIFEETLAMAEKAGITLKYKPILPMVMRGVSATREKGVYIFTDAAREARALGLEYGKFADPIGNPVRRCYSLYPWAREQGKEIDLIISFINAAFKEGINTNNDKGLRLVVERAGLSWQEAQKVVGNSDWEDELEENRQAMYGFGSWGVPSYRLLDANGEQVLGVWGQDRLWLVTKEIERLLKQVTA